MLTTIRDRGICKSLDFVRKACNRCGTIYLPNYTCQVSLVTKLPSGVLLTNADDLAGFKGNQQEEKCLDWILYSCNFCGLCVYFRGTVGKDVADFEKHLKTESTQRKQPIAKAKSFAMSDFLKK